MPAKKRNSIETSSAPNKAQKKFSEQGSPITDTDSVDKHALKLLKASTREQALELINSGLTARPIHLLFTGIHASYFTGINPLDIYNFKGKIINHLSGRSGCFRALEHKCEIAVILLSNQNKELYESLEKVTHENHFLPFLVWVAKNNRADLFKISAFRKIFLEHKAAAKSAVLVAAAFGSTTFLLKVIEGGFINARETAKCLVVAAANGDNTLLSSLMEQNKKTTILHQNQTPTSDTTINSTVDQPLFWAIRNKHDSTVKLLLETGQSPNENIDVSGDSYLMLATRGGNIEIMGLLLEHKANVDHQDHLGNTALHYAAERNNPGVISILVENGARNLMDKKGHRPLDSIQIEEIALVAADGERLSNVDMPRP